MNERRKGMNIRSLMGKRVKSWRSLQVGDCQNNYLHDSVPSRTGGGIPLPNMANSIWGGGSSQIPRPSHLRLSGRPLPPPPCGGSADGSRDQEGWGALEAANERVVGGAPKEPGWGGGDDGHFKFTSSPLLSPPNCPMNHSWERVPWKQGKENRVEKAVMPCFIQRTNGC